MKNRLVITGLVAAGLSTVLGITNFCILEESNHLGAAAFMIGLFSIMSFVASALYKE